MNLIIIRKFVTTFLVLLALSYPLITDALTSDWIPVPKNQYGEQLWDKNNVKKNQDGSIRIFSKFIPKGSSNITQNILYTMDIDCAETSFRDIAVGYQEFNEFKNNDLEWKDPNGDELILGVIGQVCAYGEGGTFDTDPVNIDEA